MDDRSRVLMSACLGALVGGVAGYLFLTEDGARVRERLEPGMDEVLRELKRLPVDELVARRYAKLRRMASTLPAA